MNEGTKTASNLEAQRKSRKLLRQALGDQLEITESLIELVAALLKNRQYKRAEELLATVKALDANYSQLDSAALSIEKELES